MVSKARANARDKRSGYYSDSDEELSLVEKGLAQLKTLNLVDKAEQEN